MLNAITELPQHRIRNIQRILGYEINTHTFGTNQANHQLDFLNQGLGRISKQQVRLIEEKHHFGFLDIAYFGKILKQFRQQPQQEGGIQLRRIHQLVGRQNIDDAAPIGIGLHQVIHVQHGLTEKLVSPLPLQGQQATLNGAHRS